MCILFIYTTTKKSKRVWSACTFISKVDDCLKYNFIYCRFKYEGNRAFNIFCYILCFITKCCIILFLSSNNLFVNHVNFIQFLGVLSPSKRDLLTRVRGPLQLQAIFPTIVREGMVQLSKGFRWCIILLQLYSLTLPLIFFFHRCVPRESGECRSIQHLNSRMSLGVLKALLETPYKTSDIHRLDTDCFVR